MRSFSLKEIICSLSKRKSARDVVGKSRSSLPLKSMRWFAAKSLSKPRRRHRTTRLSGSVSGVAWLRKIWSFVSYGSHSIRRTCVQRLGTLNIKVQIGVLLFSRSESTQPHGEFNEVRAVEANHDAPDQSARYLGLRRCVIFLQCSRKAFVGRPLAIRGILMTLSSDSSGL